MKIFFLLFVLLFGIQDLVYSEFNFNDYNIDKSHYLEKNILYEFKNINDGKNYLKNANNDDIISKGFDSFTIRENINGEITYVGYNKNGNKYTFSIFRNGKKEYETQEGHGINNGDIEYSDDGRHLFFSTSIDSKKSQYGQGIIVLDGKEVGIEYDRAYSPAYSGDGKNFFYVGANNTLDGGKNRVSYIIKNGKVIEKNNYNILDLKVSKDGTKYAYLIFEGGLRKVVYNGIKSSSMQGNVWNYGFSSDGQSFAFYSTNDGRGIIVKDGKDISKKYTSVDDIKFSPIGNGYSFIANTFDDKQILVKDGDEIKEDGSIVGFKYGKKTNDYIYLIRKNGKTYINNNGKKSIEYDGILNDSLVYNNSSDYYFIAKKDNKYILVNNGIEYGKFDSFMGFPIKDDKGNIAIIGKNEGISAVLVNGKEIDSFSSGLLSIGFYDGKIFIKHSIDNKVNVFIEEFNNNDIKEKINTTLSEKDLKVVLNASNIINKLNISKQNQYKIALTKLLKKQKEGTRNFELIKAILEKIK